MKIIRKRYILQPDKSEKMLKNEETRSNLFGRPGCVLKTFLMLPRSGNITEHIVIMYQSLAHSNEETMIADWLLTTSCAVNL